MSTILAKQNACILNTQCVPKGWLCRYLYLVIKLKLLCCTLYICLRSNLHQFYENSLDKNLIIEGGLGVHPQKFESSKWV